MKVILILSPVIGASLIFFSFTLGRVSGYKLGVESVTKQSQLVGTNMLQQIWECEPAGEVLEKVGTGGPE